MIDYEHIEKQIEVLADFERYLSEHHSTDAPFLGHTADTMFQMLEVVRATQSVIKNPEYYGAWQPLREALAKLEASDE